jgi:hypothetical protein
MSSVSERYRDRAVPRGHEILFRFPDARQIIEECIREGLTIVRMDFYRDEGVRVVPTLLWADLYEYAGNPEGARLAGEAALEILGRHMPNGESLVSFEVA